MCKKICVECKILKEINNFHKDRIGRKNIQLYKSTCKKCRNAALNFLKHVMKL